MGFGGKGRSCAEATIPRELEPSSHSRAIKKQQQYLTPYPVFVQKKTTKKLFSLLLKSIMSDTEEDPGAPLTQADIPTQVSAVADAIGRDSATPATKDLPGEP